MNRSGLLLLLVCGILAAASIALLWCTNIPLGIPGEWTWPRIPWSIDILWGWVTCAVGAGLYFGFAELGQRRMAGCGAFEAAGWLCGLVVASFAWLMCVQDAAPAPFGLSKIPLVLYYPSSSGYFSAARDEAQDVRAYLGNYEAKMSEGDVLHIGTHPPGLILVHRGLIEVCRRFPRITDCLIQAQPPSVTAAFAVIEGTGRIGPSPPSRAERAALWLAGLIAQAAVALTAIPLYLLVRLDYPKRIAWMTACFWPLLPAVAVFLPKSDAAFPLIGASFVLAWMQAQRRDSWSLACIASFIIVAGLLLSLAFLPVALFAAILAAWEARVVERQPELPSGPRVFVTTAVAAAIAFVIATGSFSLYFRINLPAVWRLNLTNHAAFYEHFTRTYWKWLCVNPIEFLMALGAPVTVLAVWSCAASVRAVVRRQRKSAPFWAFAIVWGLLWLSGKNSGEAARLWILLMPWVLWLAAFEIEDLTLRNAAAPSPAAWRVLVAMQLVVTIATVTRMSGFHLLNPGDVAG